MDRMSPVRPSILQRERDRLLNAAARALERCQVADDPSGAADEAAAILSEVVTLDGQYVPVPGESFADVVKSNETRPAEPRDLYGDGPCPGPDGHLWVMGDKRCQVDGCAAIFRVPEPGGGNA